MTLPAPKPVIPWHIMCKLACRAMITGQDLNSLIRSVQKTKMKTSELKDVQLDWAVAKCEGIIDDPAMKIFVMGGDISIATPEGDREYYRPSENWAQGGPIIEREEVQLRKVGITTWRAIIDLDEGDMMIQENNGPTPLVAAMRCYVASELGDEVELPEELK